MTGFDDRSLSLPFDFYCARLS